MLALLCHLTGTWKREAALPTLQRPGALRSLRAGHCAGLRSMALQLPAAHTLRTLHLAGCANLAELTVVAAALETLHVGACASLRSLDLRCDNLR